MRNGGTRRTTSPLIASGSRLVASRARWGQRASRKATMRAHSSITCSQLSSTRRMCLPCRNAPSRSIGASSGVSGRVNTFAMVCTTRSEVESPASSTSHTPSANLSVSPAATSSARRVLRVPPVPVSMTSRCSCRCCRTWCNSTSRPMKLDTEAGKLCWWAALSAGIRTSRGTDVEGADRHRRRRASLVRR